MSSWKRGVLWLADRILPPACPLCLRTFPGSWPEPFCSSCLQRFSPLPSARCSCCALPFRTSEGGAHRCVRCLQHPPPYEIVYAAGLYEAGIREAIQRFKFRGAVSLDRPLARWLRYQLPADLACCQIVPVPLHPERLRERGYNQALLLARELGRLLQRPVTEDLLLRCRITRSQRELSAVERAENLADAFVVSRPLQGERLLLVDDVMTTGATLEACSRQLQRAGAGRLEIAVLARAPVTGSAWQGPRPLL